ncbi:hypothetical protein [Mesorhizobium sp. CAU 1741]|uniref:hypothetical protein n=1 Tax=Mesorhizobium sp. CAU 1741 TaxID=3140366 RepID=UPI00325B01FF
MPAPRSFDVEGLGWTAIVENEEIIFYRMNGFGLGTFSKPALELDMGCTGLSVPGAFSLGQNVPSHDDVIAVMQQLAKTGGRMGRGGDAPPHAG